MTDIERLAFTFMNSNNSILLLLLLSGVLLSPDVLAQHKFEFGVSIDPIVAPINFLTYVEDGPGYYDIHGRGKITQAGAVYFNYWPFKNIGISIGEGIRSFRSEIDYAIPEPVGPGLVPLFESSNPFSAIGWGSSLSILWRMERWKARIGYGFFDLYNLKFKPNYSVPASTTFDTNVGIIADLQLEEKAYWNNVPYSYGFLQFEARYNVRDNLFVKVGFETTGRSRFPPPYTLLISGFTPESGPSRVLNDFKMQHSLTSFSFGMGYNFGFGRYKYNKQNDE